MRLPTSGLGERHRARPIVLGGIDIPAHRKASVEGGLREGLEMAVKRSAGLVPAMAARPA
ncbi:hypothetical protein [Aureimonas pseudogalii]|uniref:Uncharacterized protein n=1 Tax=Aureimonas pseudogalii TaxID=1744844 RepID=A0A7W6H3A7_9HYPH|nr:hypothetical protein [Aureimonas pseudogalii]MBB3996678.1 hypothetical protein [Aureimonas pseudogalii]